MGKRRNPVCVVAFWFPEKGSFPVFLCKAKTIDKALAKTERERAKLRGPEYVHLIVSW